MGLQCKEIKLQGCPKMHRDAQGYAKQGQGSDKFLPPSGFNVF